MEQVPVFSSVTISFAVLQTVGVIETMPIGDPELVRAATAKGAAPRVWLGMGSNAIAWVWEYPGKAEIKPARTTAEIGNADRF